MGSCLSLSSGPSPKNSMFTSTAFGRSAYVRIENQSILEKSVPVNEDEYCSDEEDLLDVGFMNVPVPVGKMRLKGGRFEIGREQECDGKMLVEMKIDSPKHNLSSQDKQLPSSPEEGSEPPFEGMVKVWSEEGSGRWMWPRGVGVPVVVSEDYRKWREQRAEGVGGAGSRE